MVVSSLKSLFCVVSTKPLGSVQQSWYPVWQSPLVLVQRVLRLRTAHLSLLNSMKFPCAHPSSLPGVTSLPRHCLQTPWGVPAPPPGSQNGLNRDGSQGKPLRDPVVLHVLLLTVPCRSSSVPPQAGSISRSLCLLTELILAGLQQLPAFWCLTNLWFRDGFYL